jgi:lipoprotein-releasing system ATP-binding protein
VIRVFQRIAREQGRAVVCVTHDPTVAAAADRRIYMLDGSIERVE